VLKIFQKSQTSERSEAGECDFGAASERPSGSRPPLRGSLSKDLFFLLSEDLPEVLKIFQKSQTSERSEAGECDFGAASERPSGSRPPLRGFLAILLKN
jgi:hypothetical protein